MIIATHGIIASQMSGIDADAQAFFDRVTTAGGSLSNTEKTAVIQLVLDLKGYSIWSKMKAIYPMVGASSAACAQNLKSSSFTGTFSGGWTYASTGVRPNGSTGFFNTALNSSTNLTKTSTHLCVYVRNNSNTGSPYDMGNGSGGMTTDATYLITRYSSNTAFIGIADSSYATSASSTDSRGFWCGTTNGSASQILYRNSSSFATGTAGSGNLANRNLYLGAANDGGTAFFFADKEYALCSIGDGLSGTEASNFYTAVQAFQTTLSRQV